MFVLQQFSIDWLLSFKIVHVNKKKVNMLSIFNWADGRNQYQQSSVISWEVEVVDRRPDTRGVKTAHVLCALTAPRHESLFSSGGINGIVGRREIVAKWFS
jgi:hypothetical protein